MEEGRGAVAETGHMEGRGCKGQRSKVRAEGGLSMAEVSGKGR